MKDGKKYDKDKLPWHWMPFDALAEVVKVNSHGADKYGPHNWQQLDQPEDRYFSAIMRHITAIRQGESRDKDSGLYHWAHIACNALYLTWFAMQKENKEVL